MAKLSSSRGLATLSTAGFPFSPVRWYWRRLSRISLKCASFTPDEGSATLERSLQGWRLSGGVAPPT